MQEYFINLFVVALEECAEIQQVITKIFRFGLDNYHPDDENRKQNKEKLLEEYYQLQAVVEKLQEVGVLNKPTDDEIQEIKKKKMSNVDYWFCKE